MTLQIIPITDDKQWHDLRRQDVTASEVAALFGQYPFKTALRVFSEKSGAILPQNSDNSAMQQGRWAEGMFPAAMKEQEGIELFKETDYYRDSVIRLGATPDFKAMRDGKKGKIEAKICTPDIWEKWGETLPIHYLLQHQAQYAVDPESEWGGIALIIMRFKKSELKWFPIDPRPVTIQKIRDTVIQFWKDVAENNPPPANYKTDTETLKMLYRDSDGEPIDLNGDNRLPGLLDRYLSLKAQVKEADSEIEEIANEIRDKMGSAERGIIDGFKLSYKSFAKKEYTVAASIQRQLRVSRA